MALSMTCKFWLETGMDYGKGTQKDGLFADYDKDILR